MYFLTDEKAAKLRNFLLDCDSDGPYTFGGVDAGALYDELFPDLEDIPLPIMNAPLMVPDWFPPEPEEYHPDNEEED